MERQIMPDTNSSLEAEPTQRATRSKFIIFLPLIFLSLLAAMFIWGLKFNPNGPNYIPSVLIGKKVEFTLGKMDGLNGTDGQPIAAFSSLDLDKGEVSIVNVWASWCIACRAEHRFLERLNKKSGAPVYGLNYKDTASAGRKFLARYGNPYKAVGMDARGRVGIDLGVYAVPETFVIDGNGIIRYKKIGPITSDEMIEKELLPAIRKARASSKK